MFSVKKRYRNNKAGRENSFALKSTPNCSTYIRLKNSFLEIWTILPDGPKYFWPKLIQIFLWFKFFFLTFRFRYFVFFGGFIFRCFFQILRSLSCNCFLTFYQMSAQIQKGNKLERVWPPTENSRTCGSSLCLPPEQKHLKMNGQCALFTFNANLDCFNSCYQVFRY